MERWLYMSHPRKRQTLIFPELKGKTKMPICTYISLIQVIAKLCFEHFPWFLLEFVNYTQDKEAPPPLEREPSPTENKKPDEFSEQNFDDLMARVRHHVLTNRRRVSVTLLTIVIL